MNAIVVLQVIITLGGPPVHLPETPAEALEVLRRSPGLSNRTNASPPLPVGPTWAATGTLTPTAGPWLWPEPSQARRLDGTLLSQPPDIYGFPGWPFVVITSQPIPERRPHGGTQR